MAAKLIIAGLWRASAVSCCGGSCPIEFGGPPAGCNVPEGLVTKADGMEEEEIHEEGYWEELNASCASGFAQNNASFSVQIVTYDCPRLCPTVDFGPILFQECCEVCRRRATNWHALSRTFTHCIGCPATSTPVIPGQESVAAFESRVITDVSVRVLSLWGIPQTQYDTQSLRGSDHPGAYHTDLREDLPAGVTRDTGRVNEVTTGTISHAAGVATAAIPGTVHSERLLQQVPAQPVHMAATSYGYNTRCAVGTPAPCHGNFTFKRIDCADCRGVPVLQRACCRDCGCAMARQDPSSEFLWCEGCACNPMAAVGATLAAVGANQTARIQDSGLEAWLRNFMIACRLNQSEHLSSSSPLPSATSNFHVLGQIPLTFDNPGELLGNPRASTAVAEAVAELTGVPASNITVSFNDTRRLKSNRGLEDDTDFEDMFEDVTDERVDKTPAMVRRLSGVINANFDIAAPHQRTADLAAGAIETWPPNHTLATIDSHLSSVGIVPASSIGEIVVSHIHVSQQGLAVQTQATQSVQTQANPSPLQENPGPGTAAGSWFPAVIGTLVALMLAGVAAAVYLTSSKAKPPKKVNAKRALHVSPGPQRTQSPPGPQSLQVQPTVSTALPVLTSPAWTMPRVAQPAQAVSIPHPPLRTLVQR